MLFDDQAKSFDNRAGLPHGAAENIAAALVEMAGGAKGGFWLEIGAGTGEIGAWLARLPIRYLGFDASLPMLEEFRKRGPLPPTATLLQSDGNKPWPAPDGGVDVFFSSRALHLLEWHHVLRQLQGKGASGGWVLITGKVRRDEGSPKFAMRRQMRRILKEKGYQGRGEKTGGDPVLEACEAGGAVKIPPRVAARWKIAYAPNHSIESWRGKQGLGGLQLPQEAKDAVLDQLTQWAKEHFGDMERTVEMEEWYELNGLRMDPQPKA